DLDTDSAGPFSHREQVPPSLVVPTRLKLGEPSTPDPTRARQPSRNALDGPLRVGRRDSRNSESRVGGLLHLPRLHPDEEARCRSTVPARQSRNPSLDHLSTRRNPVGGSSVMETWCGWPRGSSLLSP